MKLFATKKKKTKNKKNVTQICKTYPTPTAGSLPLRESPYPFPRTRTAPEAGIYRAKFAFFSGGKKRQKIQFTTTAAPHTLFSGILTQEIENAPPPWFQQRWGAQPPSPPVENTLNFRNPCPAHWSTQSCRRNGVRESFFLC